MLPRDRPDAVWCELERRRVDARCGIASVDAVWVEGKLKDLLEALRAILRASEGEGGPDQAKAKSPKREQAER